VKSVTRGVTQIEWGGHQHLLDRARRAGDRVEGWGQHRACKRWRRGPKVGGDSALSEAGKLRSRREWHALRLGMRWQRTLRPGMRRWCAPGLGSRTVGGSGAAVSEATGKRGCLAVSKNC
jgi:hypothetical protein